jgi:ACS family hexuronate transporter-like MFS transporter
MNKPGKKIKNFRFVLVGFLLILSVINYGDRSAFGVASKDIMNYFHLTPVAFGVLAGVFAFGYAPFNLIGGWLGDRFSPRRILQLAVTIWSLTIIVLPFSSGYVSLFINRVLFGISEGPNFSIDTKLMSQWLRKKELGVGLSFVTVGQPLGVAFLTPVFGILIAWLGWKLAFVVIGSISLLWLLGSFYLLSNSPQESKFVSEEELKLIQSDSTANELPGNSEKGATVSWGQILSNRSIQGAAWSFFTFAYTNYMMLTWLPSYFSNTFNFDIKGSALVSAIPWIGAVLGLLLGGFISDKILIRTNNARLARGGVIGTCLIIVGILEFLVTKASSPIMGIVLLTVSMFVLYATYGLYYVIGASIAPKNAVGRVTGFIQGISSIPGFFAPAITGVLISSSGGGFNLAFGVASAVVLVGGVIALLAIKMDPIEIKAKNVERVSNDVIV